MLSPVGLLCWCFQTAGWWGPPTDPISLPIWSVSVWCQCVCSVCASAQMNANTLQILLHPVQRPSKRCCKHLSYVITEGSLTVHVVTVAILGCGKNIHAKPFVQGRKNRKEFCSNGVHGTLRRESDLSRGQLWQQHYKETGLSLAGSMWRSQTNCLPTWLPMPSSAGGRQQEFCALLQWRIQ